MEKQSKKAMKEEYRTRKVTGGIAAIKNTANGKMYLLSTTDLQGRKNRFEFSKKMGQCDDLRLKEDCKVFGSDSFVLEVLEELEKSESQTNEEFKADLKILYDMWLEKTDPATLY